MFNGAVEVEVDPGPVQLLVENDVYVPVAVLASYEIIADCLGPSTIHTPTGNPTMQSALTGGIPLFVSLDVCSGKFTDCSNPSCSVLSTFQA